MSEFASRQAMLRTLTRREHESIETAPALARLMSRDLTREEYTEVLTAQYAFHVQLEAKILRALPLESDARILLDGRRIRALQQDLQWLGVQHHSRSAQTPDIDSHSSALGALYVVEGSGLGGRVIARHLADSLAVSDGKGACFYDGLTADMARVRWRVLCSALEANDPTLSATLMLAGARATFVSLENTMREINLEWLQPCLAAVAAD